MATAVFIFSSWAAQFPEFASLDPQLAQSYFNTAGTLFRNDGTSPVPTDEAQTQIMYVLTAHLAKLYGPKSGGGQAGGLVGRINNASEGSVSVATEMDVGASASASMAFYMQTVYGAQFWQMTAAYRTMHYRSVASRPYLGPRFLR